jgi:ATP-dependent helicase YprA (DUF1998 family)
MALLKLAKYTEDDRLDDTGDAEIVRRKLDDDVQLDFSGVLGVSSAFLDTLLEGRSPEWLADRVAGAIEAVDAELASWAERASAVVPAEAPRRGRKVRVTRPAPMAPVVEREPLAGDRFTPTRLVSRLRETLRGYIESAYPLSDPVLVRSRRLLLDREADGHLLAQEPFVETTTRYAASPLTYDKLGLAAHVGDFFDRMSRTPARSGDDRTALYPRMYGHQERAFKSFLVDGKDVVVATGTGSGKTECFLVPMLGTLYDEAHQRPESFAKPGVRALILYPMNALVNDQLARLRMLFGEQAVASEFATLGEGRFPRFGMYTGRTPYPGPRSAAKDGERVAPLLDYYLEMDAGVEAHLRQLGRYPAKDLEAFYARQEESKQRYKSGGRKGEEYRRHNWDRRLQTATGDRELLTRHEMVHGSGTRPGHAPDVLVTNYSMLEYMLMRPFERPIFEETRRWLEQEDARFLLVLDEAHMYRGAPGAEVAFLLRRLTARLGIHDRPDKLRVIATSASLGTHKSALENVRRFAADLSGKQPTDFEAVTGTREMPSPAALAGDQEARLFASVDIDRLNQALGAAELRTALAPLLSFYGVDPVPESEAELLEALYRVLEGKPYLNQLVKESSGSARALSDLTVRVFGEHADGLRSLEALLALSALARTSADSPGLVPTRVHAMFRGLHGIYACLNPVCPGRQAEPGGSAVLGKLFSAPRPVCDDCGCRVFELASCRSCGVPYLLAHTESGTLDSLEFLWGETEGNLVRFQLLPVQPRYPERTEEIRVHLKTGYVDREIRYPDVEVQHLHLYLDGDGKRQTEFGRCVMCQPSASASGRILDFRTRGEQPFTALIEAQFAEQPPQKRDPRLPNHGRKVLVFSDGRQKAARLAPALEHSHARDLFRQVIALASDELHKQKGSAAMLELYPAVVWLCGNRGYDLFPSADEVEFHNHLRIVKGKSLTDALRFASRGLLRPTKAFAQALFEEVTDRYYSLPSLALATIEEDPGSGIAFDDFPEVGLDDPAKRALFRAWIRLHLERKSFRPDGAELGDLGEGWARPNGIDASKRNDVLPLRFEAYLDVLLESDKVAVDRVCEWLKEQVRSGLLTTFEGDLYYLQPAGLSVNLRLQGEWFRCADCGRIHPEALESVCPGCCGKLVNAEAEYLDARTGFYRDQVLRAFDDNALEPFGLSAAEHSAQLTGAPDDSAFNKVEEYELRFQDIALDGKPPIDVLSCTTTMEVGIDIGALTGVALRNVPPHVANYQQRAGRAGRRGRSIASVITYAHGSSHDSHYFENPAAIISGEVRAPLVYVENQQVLRRHVYAYLVQRFFHETVPADTGSSAYMLFESLGTVEQFLSDAHACSFPRLDDWLRANQGTLQEELRHWVPRVSHGLGEEIEGVDGTIADAVPELLSRLREVLPVDDFTRREELEGLEREALEQRLSEKLLQTLVGRAVFPRYAFPTDVVSFWVARGKQPGEPAGKRSYDYEPQRDLQLALTEYAPGRSLTIDKWRFESAALYSPYEPDPQKVLARRQPYTSCNDCGFVSLEPAAVTFATCPCCGGDQLRHSSFVTPQGFAPDINARREVDRGQAVVYVGSTDRAQLEVQDPPETWDRELCDGRLRIWTGPRMLAMVNKGVGERGFRVCPDCGRSEPEYGPGFTRTTLTKAGTPIQHPNPLEKGLVCAGIADGPFYLGHRFPTDALLLRVKVASPFVLGSPATPGLLGKAARMALTSLVEAIALAATRELQIDEGEVAGWWAPVVGGRAEEAQLYLYDLLPGGAGYARAVGNAIEQVLAAAEALLAGCDCTTSCYRCIRHYGNNYIHASLDRHLALALLRHVRSATLPALAYEDKVAVLGGLRETLRLRCVAAEEDVPAGDVTVPSRMDAGKGWVWIDVHHPLVDPAAAPSAVSLAARDAFQELVELDAFALVHDLPEAVRRLQLP